MSDWTEIMPTIDKMDVVTGTPVRFLKGDEVSGFPLRNDMSLTVRPWGDENDNYCMVIDDKGTSVPCPMDSLVIDLGHPLGFASAMQWVYRRFAHDGYWNPLFAGRMDIARGESDERDRGTLAGVVSDLSASHSAEE